MNESFIQQISLVINNFLDTQASFLKSIGNRLSPFEKISRKLASGGKRLRPAFCYWGYVAVADQPENNDAILTAAASLDLLHISALVHDDIIDASDTRRSMPSAHRQLQADHEANNRIGDAETFGKSQAILLGDLILSWSVEMLETAGLSDSQLRRCRPIAQITRNEVICGQSLDLLAECENEPDINRRLILTNQILEYKSARYSIMRPIQFGAAIAGADKHLLDKLGEFGSPIGRAFQLRDDLLGIFGDPELTGKPAGDDLREGKQTTLILYALQGLPESKVNELNNYLGNPSLSPAEISVARALIIESGAKEKVEQDISNNLANALNILSSCKITRTGYEALSKLAKRSVKREY